MSISHAISNAIKVGGGCLAVVAALAFAQHDDERAKLEEEALMGPVSVVLDCKDVKPNDTTRDGMECAP